MSRINENAPNQKQIFLYNLAPFILLGASLIAISALLGWQFDIEFFKRPISGLVAMNPLTSLCILLISVAFILRHQFGTKGPVNFIAIPILIIVDLVCLVRIIEIYSNVEESIDLVLFSKQIALDNLTNVSSSMGINSSFTLFFIALSGLIPNRTYRLNVVRQFVALIAGYFALMPIIGYSYQITEFYDALERYPMALNTAICLVLLVTGFLFKGVNAGIMKDLTSIHRGGKIAGIAFPLAIVVPVLTGWISVLLINPSEHSPHLAIATIVTVFIFFLSIPIAYMVHRFNKYDRERTQRQKEISTSNAILKATLESTGDVIIVAVDLDYKIINYNSVFKKETKSAYGTVVKIGTYLYDVITNEHDRLKSIQNLEKAKKGESHTTEEVYGDMVLSYYETHYNPMFNRNNEVIGITVISQNVTTRTLARKEIENLNKELEAYSYSVAHDLRSPLRIIDGYVHVLEDEYTASLDDQAREYMRIISANTRRMGQLIDDVLKFSQVSRSEITKDDVNMNELTKSIINDLKCLKTSIT